MPQVAPDAGRWLAVFSSSVHGELLLNEKLKVWTCFGVSITVVTIYLRCENATKQENCWKMSF